MKDHGGFLDAQVRCDRVRSLLESMEGFSVEQVTGYDLIPGDTVIREFIGGGTTKIPHNE